MINQTNTNTFDKLTWHLLNDNIPSKCFNDLGQELDKYPLKMIKELKDVKQSPKYHPEGNVWNHTMMVIDEAAKVRENCSDSKMFMWAALLHDIGKPETTKIRRGRITSYDHDIVGAKLCIEFLEFFTDNYDFVRKVSNMVKYHMHMLYVLKGLSFGNPTQMIKETNIDDIALLCRCDRLGRIGANQEVEEKNYREFLNIVSGMSRTV